MKTVIKNSAHIPCIRVSLTLARPAWSFSEVHQPQRGLSSSFNSFHGHPTQFEYIRPNPTNFSYRRSPVRVGPVRVFKVRCSKFDVSSVAVPAAFDQGADRRTLAKPSPTQSNPVQPNPTKSNHPSPPGKGIGKETACPPERFPDRRSASDQGGWQRRVSFWLFLTISTWNLEPSTGNSFLAFSRNIF
jgi:hypothetical protein